MARQLSVAWHEAFSRCCGPHTDAPDSFLTWSALSLIGASLKNNVHLKSGTYVIYPNLYVVLVSPPGIGKGTAMDLVESIVDDTKPNEVVNTMKDRNTVESMLIDIETGWNTAPKLVNQQLVTGAMDHSCFFMSSEIRTLLGASDWMLEFLEEAWSKTRYRNKTKNKGVVQITDMCFSLLAASVPDFLRGGGREANMVITGGFSSRCFFICEDRPSKNLPWPEPLKNNRRSKELWDKLTNDIREITKLNGEFSVDSLAKIIFENYLTKNIYSMSDDASEAVQNARARVRANTLKLAMVFSASRCDDLIINQIDMQNAIGEAQKVLKTLEKLFRGAGDSDMAPAVARVQNFIEINGPSSKNDIMRKLYSHIGTVENLDRCLWVLESIGFCAPTVIPGSKITYYKQIPKVPLTKNGTRP